MALQDRGSGVTVVSAEVAYDEFLRTRVAPGLRARGFKGSGQRFERRTSPETALVLRFEKDRWNSGDVCQFRLWFLVGSNAAWAAARHENPGLPERPAPGYWLPPGTSLWTEDAGVAADVPHRHQMTVATGIELDELAGQILGLVDRLQPMVEQFLATGSRPPADRWAVNPYACETAYCVDDRLLTRGPSSRVHWSAEDLATVMRERDTDGPRLADALAAHVLPGMTSGEAQAAAALRALQDWIGDTADFSEDPALACFEDGRVELMPFGSVGSDGNVVAFATDITGTLLHVAKLIDPETAST